MRITAGRIAATRRGWASRSILTPRATDRWSDRFARKLENQRRNWRTELAPAPTLNAKWVDSDTGDDWSYDCETGWHPESQKSREASPQKED